ncbi:hypothetical protein [Streptomyces sp. CB02923]|uniref:hypothetical protein n=1 Tax=Streptomyces sp. CB02923 TaxID=1718985 RepID=UPI00093886DB|nr:hypothetical protein [Streptomyces sp. CB02923]
MTRSGPQKYPGASTAYWYQGRYGGDAMETNTLVWHTTEGRTLPSYDGGRSAPTFTAVPDFAARKLRWYQHFDFDTSARALENRAGGVETNTLNVGQVELVATCDPDTHRRWGSTPHLYTPELPSWVIRDLGDFARWARDHHSVPLTCGVQWRAYPSSYGASSVRMSNAAWTNYRGHCGHQHVPEQSHGDPGQFPMSAILAAAKGGPTPEDDMALSDADVRKIWAYPLINPIDKTQDNTRQAGTYLRYADHRQVTLLGRLDSALARLDHIEAALKTITDRLNADS